MSVRENEKCTECITRYNVSVRENENVLSALRGTMCQLVKPKMQNYHNSVKFILNSAHKYRRVSVRGVSDVLTATNILTVLNKGLLYVFCLVVASTCILFNSLYSAIKAQPQHCIKLLHIHI